MLEKLKLVEARYLEMAERAAQPDFYNDPKAASQLLKEQRQLEPIITAYRSYRRTQAEQEDLRAMLSEGLEPEMKAPLSLINSSATLAISSAVPGRPAGHLANIFL